MGFLFLSLRLEAVCRWAGGGITAVGVAPRLYWMLINLSIDNLIPLRKGQNNTRFLCIRVDLFVLCGSRLLEVDVDRQGVHMHQHMIQLHRLQPVSQWRPQLLQPHGAAAGNRIPSNNVPKKKWLCRLCQRRTPSHRRAYVSWIKPALLISSFFFCCRH